MPGLVRKLLIIAAADGFILENHSHTEPFRAIQVDYKTGNIRSCSQSEADQHKDEDYFESHGILGLLSLASYSFLIAVTRREQVAQIFGKPIYVVTDVAILPLSSQNDARESIRSTIKFLHDSKTPKDVDFSDSELEEGENREHTEDTASSPTDEDRPHQHRSSYEPSIARDVFANRGQYGRFASQWFMKQGWNYGNTTSQGSKSSDPPLTLKKGDLSPESETEGVSAAPSHNVLDKDHNKDSSLTGSSKTTSTETTIRSILPKIIHSTRQILSSRSFYFSYDIDLTQRIAVSKGKSQLPTSSTIDSLYFWNRRLASPLLRAGCESFIIPIMQGFVGQRQFIMQRSKSEAEKPESTKIIPTETEKEHVAVEDALAEAKLSTSQPELETEAFLLTLISRRSTKRSGLRYLRRGIDDEGNCANAVETEQILSSATFDQAKPLRSFVQIRGSIPLYFSQSPYSFKPVPVLHHPTSVNDAALKKHFQDLNRRYGDVQVAVLVDKHGGELTIGEAFEKSASSLSNFGSLPPIGFEWFDFHSECRGMKFENVDRLVRKLEDRINSFGETVVINGTVQQNQTGVIRTNCMDCLDRTNVAQSAFGQYVLQRDLHSEGYQIDLLHDHETTWFNSLWADNGDAVSRQYASTAALKGDFTRTRQRSRRGALNDLSLTLTRYYNNMVNDYFSQALIDTLLGNVSWEIWLDFESDMMSVDPGISIDKVREMAIENCIKVVVQDESEDLIHGWTMLVPAQENTLRTTPFEEAVVLLTDQALYCCRFDWTTEKVASFEKVDLRSISTIRYGVYITSTLSDRQMDEESNVGLVIIYSPRKEDVIRTNTRSLQNYVPSTDSQTHSIDGGTGIVSWLSTRAAPTSRTLALKIIVKGFDSDRDHNKQLRTPLSVAEHRCDEISRVITGSMSEEEKQRIGFVEKGDIISVAEAKKRTGYFEQIGHSIRKLVWT